MIVWLLFIIILIGLMLSISMYMYDNCEFSKMTGYSYFNLWTDQKIRKTYKLMKTLDKAHGNHKVLLNLQLQANGKKKRLIDAVLIHESGVFIIDVNRCSGWIYGREQDLEWMQVLQRDKLNKFNNPILESKRTIHSLKQLLPELDSSLFHSLIVFSDSGSFKKIEIHSNNTDVIKTNELKSYWKDINNPKLSMEEISKVYDVLKNFMDFSQQIKQKIKNVPVN